MLHNSKQLDHTNTHIHILKIITLSFCYKNQAIHARTHRAHIKITQTTIKITIHGTLDLYTYIRNYVHVVMYKNILHKILRIDFKATLRVLLHQR